MKILKIKFLVLTIFILPFAAFADITGLWTGSTVVSGNGAIYPNTITFIQSSSVVIGSTPPSTNGICTYSGTVSGDQITLSASCPAVNYSSTSAATLNAANNSMQGTFSDSQGTTGTFSLSKQKNVLTPGKQLTESALGTVQSKTATITLLKFDSAQPKGGKTPKVNYEVTVKGAEKRTVTSKKNIITLKNLKSGNYTVTYKVLAVINDEKVYASKRSPAASFVIE
jgi:hypothetical protein